MIQNGIAIGSGLTSAREGITIGGTSIPRLLNHPMSNLDIHRPEPLLHVVLYQPDIPQNTGNIGRSCVAVGAKLWLVRPLGFQLDEKHLRRAGMDYWPHLDWEVVDHWTELRNRLTGRTFWCVELPASKSIWDANFQKGDVLVFGSETRGLPPSILEEFRSTTIQLPVLPTVRSLNLASTANTVIYEAVRQFGGRL